MYLLIWVTASEPPQSSRLNYYIMNDNNYVEYEHKNCIKAV